MYQDILLSLAKAVANTTAALVLKAKNVAAQCKDEQPLQNTIIAAATHCALATSQLVACAKVVAPTLHNPACREQLTSAARLVAQAVERLVSSCQQAPPAAGPGVEQLVTAAQRVTDELERLLAHCHLDRRVQPSVVEQSVEGVVCASESVTEAADGPEMVRRARLLGQATARLIADIKTEAENQPSDSQRKLLAAAKLLADATARMVEAARLCASLPQDREKQENLRRAAEELKIIAADYGQHQAAPDKHRARLAESARQAASSATQLITSAHNAAHYNTNKYSQDTLSSECDVLEQQAARLARAARSWAAAPAQPAANLDLLAASDAFLQPSGHVIQAARGVLPTISDATAAKQLADTTHQFTASCADLRSSASRARSSGRGGELEAAEHVLLELQDELEQLEAAARDLELTPVHGHTAEWAYSALQTSGRSASSAGAQLAAGARRGDGAAAGRAASELAAALRDFTPPLRAAVTNASDTHRHKVLSCGKQVLQSSLTLVQRVQAQLASGQTDDEELMSLARAVSQNIEHTVDAAPALRELDAALDSIAQTLGVLDMGEFPTSDRPYSELQTELNSAAVELNSASARVAEGGAPEALPPAAEDYLTAFDRLIAVGLEMAGRTEELESRTQMMGSLKTVTVNSSKLLITAKSVSQDLTRPNAKNQLAAAARAVTDSINALVDVCTEAAPGQKECAAAVRNMQAARALLTAPSQPLTEMGYFDCLDAVVDQSKLLSEGMSGMAGAVKVGPGATDRLCRSVGTVASAVQGLVECTAQAAYLVARVSWTRPSSRARRPPLTPHAPRCLPRAPNNIKCCQPPQPSRSILPHCVTRAELPPHGVRNHRARDTSSKQLRTSLTVLLHSSKRSRLWMLITARRTCPAVPPRPGRSRTPSVPCGPSQTVPSSRRSRRGSHRRPATTRRLYYSVEGASYPNLAVWWRRRAPSPSTRRSGPTGTRWRTTARLCQILSSPSSLTYVRRPPVSGRVKQLSR
ncbi:unnamed protein product [Danaus chrysippus]|uniref:(African queen) hypothetical protein n=1 Tax=Danaus chrysippus TaxID=151541 RepID=A0A8J2W6A5_9NEOP|nr:unnamed protein product [Danaus chrysippus]